MKVQQYIKKLNNTDSGQGTSHIAGVLVLKDSLEDVRKLLSGHEDMNLEFNDRISKVKINKVRFGYKRGSKEWRITGLNSFYTSNSVRAGDEVLFERRDFDGIVEFNIDLNINKNLIFFQKNNKGFEALNFDRLENKLSNGIYTLNVMYLGQTSTLDVKFKELSKKRSDSPKETNFYDLIINGNSISKAFKSDEYIELEEIQTLSNLRKVSVWQKYEFQL